MAYLLDTSFLIDLDRGNPQAETFLRGAKEHRELVFVPAIAAFEFLRGMPDVRAAFQEVDAGAVLLDFTDADVVVASDLARELAKAGKLPGMMDALIAGLAKSRGDLTIVTANPKHFPLSKTRAYR